MNILITGATGFIGSHVVRALIARGHRIKVCVRTVSAASLPLNVATTSFDFAAPHTPEDWLPLLQNIDVVINTVGIIRETKNQTFEALHRQTPIALFHACAQAGVRRVIQISALGADESAVSRYHLSKRAADDALASLHEDWVVLRPSLVYGPGGVSDSLFKALAALPFIPVVGNGNQPIRPVHIDDLVATVIACVDLTIPLNRPIDVVGGDEITFSDYLSRLRRWLELGPAHYLHVPYPIALRGAKLAGFLGSAPVDAEAITMLQRGNTAPVEPLADALGIRPKGIDSRLEARPALPADRWHARLFFLRLPLRLTIAFVWIWAGLTSAWLYPQNLGYELLMQVGITGAGAPFALYGASLLDIGLGAAMLAGWRIRDVAILQIALMLGYTAIITLLLPDQWLHPFGPVSKNLPLLVATLVMISMEEKKR